MFGFNRSRYSLHIDDEIKRKLARGGKLTDKERSDIIEFTYRFHFTQITGFEAPKDMFGKSYSDDDEDGYTPRSSRRRGDAIQKFTPPDGSSYLAGIIFILCLLTSWLASSQYIANPLITNKFFKIFGYDSLLLSTILLISAILAISPRIRFLFPALYIYLIIQEVTVGLGWVSWLLLVIAPIYYWMVKKQIKRSAAEEEKIAKAEINAELDKYLLGVQRKLNRRNI